LQKKCRQFGIVPYDEETGTGNLKHVAINIQRSTQTQQVTLVWNGTSVKGEDKIKLNDICNSLVDASENEKERRVKLHSLWVHYNDAGKHDNAIFSHTGRWQKRNGDDSVIENLEVGPKLTVPLHFPPQVFRQANLDAFTSIVVKIRQWVQQHSPKRCVELYGGVGTIGLHLADLCKSLVSSDENPYNRNCFDLAAKKMTLEPNSSDTKTKTRSPDIQYEPKNASDMVQTNAFRDADLIVVDPPRKGLDDDVVEALCDAETATSLVYVSCGFPAFMRDYRNLTAESWKLDHAEGHLLFPGSDAIETLAFFTRSST
jgi:23S rRNA (uracil1939-C5)-methyltransferase